MDAVTGEARKLDEVEEKDVIAVCCVLIVLIVVGLANASRANNGRVGRVDRYRDPSVNEDVLNNVHKVNYSAVANVDEYHKVIDKEAVELPPADMRSLMGY